MVIVMFVISITVYEISAVKIYMTLTLTFRMDKDQVKILLCKLNAVMQLPALVIVKFSQSVPVCEIITFELPQWYRIESWPAKSMTRLWATTSMKTSLDGFLLPCKIMQKWRIYAEMHFHRQKWRSKYLLKIDGQIYLVDVHLQQQMKQQIKSFSSCSNTVKPRTLDTKNIRCECDRNSTAMVLLKRRF